jgi:hypothetical protein
MATKIEIVFKQDLPEAEIAMLEKRVAQALRGEAVPELEVEGQHIRDFRVDRPDHHIPPRGER